VCPSEALYLRIHLPRFRPATAGASPCHGGSYCGIHSNPRSLRFPLRCLHCLGTSAYTTCAICFRSACFSMQGLHTLLRLSPRAASFPFCP
jgi:hypothetical protein